MTDTPTATATSTATASRPGAGGPRGFRAELRDAVTGRAAALVVAVLAIQLGFIASYVGAFHHPTPHDIPLAVTAADGVPAAGRSQADAAVARTVAALDGITGSPVDARAVDSVAAGRSRLGDRDVDGVLVLDPSGTSDRLLVAGAGSAAVADALTQVLTAADSAQQRTVAVDDVIPAGAQDARGLSTFYLAVGWVVGGYLVASLLGVSAGARPANRRRAAIRLSALAVYAVASGLLGASVMTAIVPTFGGHLPALAGLGALVVFGVGALTMALQTVFGTIGIGLAIILFVVLGNPSAGGPYPGVLLPGFWRAVGPWLAPGIATDGIRGTVYFDGAGLGRALALMAGYAVVGVAVTVLASRPRRLSGAHVTPGVVPA